MKSPWGLWALLFFCNCSLGMASVVSVRNSPSGWILLVDGKNFYVKGVRCNDAEGPKQEDYLRMAKDMGANAVRTWGFTPQIYFDKALKYGLKVDAGVWFNPVSEGTTDSYKDAGCCKRLTDETLSYVRKMKNHPSLLMWNLGNEVFGHTQDESERVAFGAFLKNLIDAVHKEDPDHPVIYSSDGTVDLPYLKSYVPNVDIVGINTYGSFAFAANWLLAQKFDKPIIATEFGCQGGWDATKDENGFPTDAFDQYKAQKFNWLWREIVNTPTRALGGFAFVLGNSPNQFSLTWWNMNFGEEKRQGYWTLYTAYTGQQPTNHCPLIKTMKIDRTKNLRPGDEITVSVEAEDQDGDPLSINYFITDIEREFMVLRPPMLFSPKIKRLSPTQAQLSIPKDPDIYRVYAVVRDGHENVAIANRSFEVLAAAP